MRGAGRSTPHLFKSMVMPPYLTGGGGDDEEARERGARADNRTDSHAGVIGATAVHTPPLGHVRRRLIATDTHGRYL